MNPQEAYHTAVATSHEPVERHMKLGSAAPDEGRLWGMLTKEERVEKFGIECESQVIFEGWEAGGEFVRNLVLRNVSLHVQKIKYKLPVAKCFILPYPDPIKLAPGMAITLPVNFTPLSNDPIVDFIDVFAKAGSFQVAVKAFVRDVSVSIPQLADFQLCAVNEEAAQDVRMYNTGTLPVVYEWTVDPPFNIRPRAGRLRVGELVHCTLGFQPPQASVYEARLLLDVRHCVGEDKVDLARTARPRQLEMQAVGVGKFPFLTVPPSFEPRVDFGQVNAGETVRRTLPIVNASPVRVKFSVLPVHEAEPLAPLATSVEPTEGYLDAQAGTNLEFTFKSTVVGENVLQKYNVHTEGGVKFLLTAEGIVTPLQVTASTNVLQFGEVPCGTPVRRALQLRNDSSLPALYHAVNMDARGVFTLDRPSGVIPPASFIVVTATFWPAYPANYHHRAFLVVQHGKPIYVDLLASSHSPTDGKQRPAFLTVSHIHQHRHLKSLGVHEFPPAEELHYDHGAHPVPPARPTPVGVYMEMMLGPEHRLRDVTVTAADLEFDLGTMRKSVTVSNHTSHKSTCVWLMPGETRLATDVNADGERTRGPSEHVAFRVTPAVVEIAPRGHAEFTVSFQPDEDGHVDAKALQCLVFPKHQRFYRLADEEHLVPPSLCQVFATGNTLGSYRSIPKVDISEQEVRFRAVPPGERSYHAIVLTNHGDANVHYQVSIAEDGDAGSFRVYPSDGLLFAKDFQLFVVEFAPDHARNERPFRACVRVMLNQDITMPLQAFLSGRCWDAKLTCGDETQLASFPPTSLGVRSSMQIPVENRSEVPIQFSCQIPSRIRQNLWFSLASGTLGPKQRMFVQGQFAPSEEKLYTATLVATASVLADPEQRLELPLAAYDEKAAPKSGTAALRLVGHGKQAMLDITPKLIDMGATQAYRKYNEGVRIENKSVRMAWYYVTVEVVEMDGGLPESVQRDALRISQKEGSVPARTGVELELSFYAWKRGHYRYTVTCHALTEKSGIVPPGAASTSFTFCTDVHYPRMRIADVRTESSIALPVSMMWQQFQVDAVNELYRGEVRAEERAFQHAMGIDEKKRLVGSLEAFTLNFGTAPQGSVPSYVYVAIENPGPLPCAFRLSTPQDFGLRDIPRWANERGICADDEQHYDWVENHEVYDVQPREGEIAPGGFVHVRFAYQHLTVGTHILPISFDILEGRSCLFFLNGHSLDSRAARLSVRHATMQTRPVPIGVEEGSYQVCELSNSGGVPASWRVDMASIERLNADAYDFEVLRVQPSEGTLQPLRSTYLHFTFTPLEGKTYTCPITVQLLREDGTVVEELQFNLNAVAYDPRGTVPDPVLVYPPSLPCQSYAPVPGFGAALSIESVDFGCIPVRSKEHRLVVLVNYSQEYTMHYVWDQREILEGELHISPSEGDLGPGAHQVVILEVLSERPMAVTGEVVCRPEWTHVSLYKPFEESQMQDVSEPEEVLALHQDHVHAAAFSKKDPYVMQHISVLHRLTASRFRHLMSTPAGQKFLNENLHRTALLSSHLPVVHPDHALPSTLGNAVTPHEVVGSSVPAAMPLSLRISVVVGDWGVASQQQHLVVPPVPTRPLGQTQAGLDLAPAPPPLAPEVLCGVLEAAFRDVVASDNLLDRVRALHGQQIPHQYAFGVSPPPSPRGAGGPAVAKFGPGDEGEDVARDVPPRLECPALAEPPSPRKLQHGDAAEQATAAGIERGGVREIWSSASASPQRSLHSGSGQGLAKMDRENFRIAAAHVLRGTVEAVMRDAVDGREAEFAWL